MSIRPRTFGRGLGVLYSWVALAACLGETKKGHWAFQPLADPPIPQVVDAAWPKTSLDAFLLSKLEKEGRKPVGAADKRTLIRRASFDLTGLPPSPEEVEGFLVDSSAEAYANLIERLLASRHYGERWGRHWLDVVRYADTAGETADYPVPVAWRYRNYVIDAFNADRPYDEFLREQIAGDILAKAEPDERYAERVTATGYLAISRRFGFDVENYHHLTIQDTIDTVGQSVLGLTIGCARCHDHKYDPVSMREYYALYGIFESTRYAFPGSEQKQKYRSMSPLLPVSEAAGKWRAFDERIAWLARALERKKQPAPLAVLRSLDDMDGDFEMQGAAAGGSKGVLVPPWVYEGSVAVTKEAQSPFKNHHALGKVGASFAQGSPPYRVGQALYPKRTRTARSQFHVNLDFRVAGREGNGAHRFWLGTRQAPAVEFLISRDALRLRTGAHLAEVRVLREGEWMNLRLKIDLAAGTLRGWVGGLGEQVEIPERRLSPGWTGTVDFVGIDGLGQGERRPGLEFDNLGVAEPPFAAPSAEPSEVESGGDVGPMQEEMRRMLADGPMPLAYGVAEGTPGNARLQERGDPDRPGPEVPRGFLRVLGGGELPPGTSGSGRLELANWLTKDNPLAARVMVNRIWQYHFGRALVATPNDFGIRGRKPTHPELLDHLAERFVESGWSTKAMHRLIMKSAAYQLASTRDPAEHATDAPADSYEIFSRRRLSAEEMRDSILAVSGELDREPGKEHPFPTPTAWGYTQHGPFAGVYDHDKRSVYLMTQRLKRHPFLALFDGADPNASTPERRVSTAPTQALYFLNDPFVHVKSGKLAERLIAQSADEGGRVNRAHLLAFARPATELEQVEAAEFLAEYRSVLGSTASESQTWAAYVRALFGSNEFSHID